MVPGETSRSLQMGVEGWSRGFSSVGRAARLHGSRPAVPARPHQASVENKGASLSVAEEDVISGQVDEGCCRF